MSSSPPGQGGIQILATATVAEAVVDVPVFISDKLQQFFVEFVEVPQLPFIDIVVGFVASQRHGSQYKLCRRPVVGQVQFLDWDTPVVVQQQGQMVQTLQSGGAAGAVPARLWTSLRSCRTSRSSRRSRKVPQLQFIVRAGFDGSEGFFSAFSAFCAIFRAPSGLSWS